MIGVRRCGKTTYVHQRRRELLEAGTPRNRLPYINFEDERLAGLEGEHLGFLVHEWSRITEANPSSKSRVHWSFDEIQVVPGWEKFVRRLIDEGDSEVVVTGSSATLLSREIGTSLRGRAWTVPLFPFSFEESRTRPGATAKRGAETRTAEGRAALERDFRRWLEVGGFPEAQSLDVESRHQLLHDYVDVAMLRDVIERHSVTNTSALRALVRHLLGNAGASFSVEKFHGALRSQGIAVSRDTVHALVAHLDDCFLVRTVWMESSSERQRMVNPRKVYPVDAGLIPIFDRTGRTNLGHALETAVLIELERRRCEITYVRTEAGLEVDFLAREPGGDEHLIQVCAEARDPTTLSRELRALEDAGAVHRRAKRWLLTLTHEGARVDAPKGTTVIPAARWMLDDL